MRKEPSMKGSLINPFHPTVVRGFSKYVRMMMNRSAASSSDSALRLVAYSLAALTSWIEQGPTTITRRSSVPCVCVCVCVCACVCQVVSCVKG